MEGVGFSVSWTTRPPRADEAEGRDYHFVEADLFLRRARDAAFLEHAAVHGFHYGTPLDEVDCVRVRTPTVWPHSRSPETPGR